MKNDAEALHKDAKAALDAIARYQPMFSKGVVLPEARVQGLTQEAPAVNESAARPPAEAEDPKEDVYPEATRRNIQGNIIPGFNKDHQHFFFYRITDVSRAKAFLREISKSITSMDEALQFVRTHRALRLNLGDEPVGLEATWVNIALSCTGMEKLLGAGAGDQFGEQSFRQGLAARSAYLGDPTNASHPGHRSHWKVGGPDNEADILVIVASDTEVGLAAKLGDVRRSADDSRLALIFEQRGDTLPGALRGHEHFGFKDGVSQPGIRGKASNAAGDFITPRYLVAVPGDQVDLHPQLFGRPGQPLLWPGQFLLGEPRQLPNVAVQKGFAAANFPSWAALGSYLVCRRLKQDVLAFWNFVAETASRLGAHPVTLAAALVGRWPSGAPLMRAPAADKPELAGDPFANNYFFFDDDTRPSSLRPITGYAGDAFAGAKADMLGAVCPHFAHIRKVNPRDSATDLGKAMDTLMRLILRRGIPFGPPIIGAKHLSQELLEQERGLMFLCYGATIEDQFEFITRRWSNSAIHPNFGGHDPVIGQQDRHGDRARFIDMPAGSSTVRVPINSEWVIPTGGGYFFAPPIAAISSVLGR
jgi:Dyp-type peroxidase family